MATYPVFYKDTENRMTLIPNKGWNTDTKQIVDTSVAPAPNVTRTFDLPLGTITGKKGFDYRVGDMIIRGDGYITFYNDFISMYGLAPRIYVYDPNRTKKWRNVEIEVEYMRVAESSNVLSYAGLGIGVRSIHETQTSSNLNVPTYYFKHTFDGRMFFEKEQTHGSSYTKQPNSQDASFPMPKNVWHKVKFTIMGNAVLKAYQWVNGAWKEVRVYSDLGSWNGKPPITEGTSCFIRTDAVTDFRIRKFSIKEIA